MIDLRIGDTVFFKGEELEITAVQFHYAANGVSASIHAVDPIIAAKNRETDKANAVQRELLASGQMKRAIDKTEKALDEGDWSP